MQYEWDEQKRLSNARKHGIDFRDAVEIFEGDKVLMEDERFTYGERRFVSLGLLQGRAIVVVYTEQGDVTRIISARKATKYEQTIYLQGIAD
jgi:uncharacterized DUF497 family protein